MREFGGEGGEMEGEERGGEGDNQQGQWGNGRSGKYSRLNKGRCTQSERVIPRLHWTKLARHSTVRGRHGNSVRCRPVFTLR